MHRRELRPHRLGDVGVVKSGNGQLFGISMLISCAAISHARRHVVVAGEDGGWWLWLVSSCRLASSPDSNSNRAIFDAVGLIGNAVALKRDAKPLQALTTAKCSGCP